MGMYTINLYTKQYLLFKLKQRKRFQALKQNGVSLMKIPQNFEVLFCV